MNRSSTRQLLVVLAYVVTVHAPFTALTWRDLRIRSAAQVRGNKRIWRLTSALNTTGSAAYWLFGRRSLA
jgi:NO-binding membrane sensor protein with MHYT domain